MTLFHFLSKIKAKHSENFRNMAKKFLEESIKILKYVGRDKVLGRRGRPLLLFFFFFSEFKRNYPVIWGELNFSFKTQF